MTETNSQQVLDPPYFFNCEKCKHKYMDGIQLSCGHQFCFHCSGYSSITTTAATMCQTCQQFSSPIHIIDKFSNQFRVVKVLAIVACTSYANAGRSGFLKAATKYGSFYPPLKMEMINVDTQENHLKLMKVDLRQYDVLLLDSCAGSFHNPSEIGDLVAQYSETKDLLRGNGVVLCHFTNTESGEFDLTNTSVTGKFKARSYHPFGYGDHHRLTDIEMDEMPIKEHFLVSNVKTFKGGSSACSVDATIEPGTHVAAYMKGEGSTQSKEPLIAYKQNPVSGNSIVALNMYNMSTEFISDGCAWESSCDGNEIFLNALVYASGALHRVRDTGKLLKLAREKKYTDLLILF